MRSKGKAKFKVDGGKIVSWIEEEEKGMKRRDVNYIYRVTVE